MFLSRFSTAAVLARSFEISVVDFWLFQVVFLELKMSAAQLVRNFSSSAQLAREPDVTRKLGEL